jgi:hypothetical protein
MTGETDLNELLKSISPKLNPGDYVFCAVTELPKISPSDIISTVREQEALTIVIKKELADQLNLTYSFIATWITLTVHSSLEAVGLTAAFSTALSNEGISCNVIAGFYHDHIFVNKQNAERALKILNNLGS